MSLEDYYVQALLPLLRDLSDVDLAALAAPTGLHKDPNGPLAHIAGRAFMLLLPMEAQAFCRPGSCALERITPGLALVWARSAVRSEMADRFAKSHGPMEIER